MVCEAALRLFHVYVIDRVVGHQHNRVTVGDRWAGGRCHDLGRHISADAAELRHQRLALEMEGG
eukprot:2417506-Prymnesium_polylepis.1